MQKLEWFFPAMLLMIGGRYLTFATLYGMRLYWALGLALGAAGVVLGRASTPVQWRAAAGAAIAAIFALACLVMHRQWNRSIGLRDVIAVRGTA